MDVSQLPLNALRAFEASARLGSLTRAGLELRVTQMFVEVGRRRGQRERPPSAGREPNQRRDHARDRLCNDLRAEPASHGVEVSEVRLDPGTLPRVSGDQGLPVACFIIGDVEGEVRVDEFFEWRWHLLPPHTEPSDEVKQLAAPVAGGHSTHVMQPDIPGAMAGPRETVGEPTEPEMALEHQDALALELSHQARDSQAPDAGTDDDEVKVPVVWSHATNTEPSRHQRVGAARHNQAARPEQHGERRHQEALPRTRRSKVRERAEAEEPDVAQSIRRAPTAPAPMRTTPASDSIPDRAQERVRRNA